MILFFILYNLFSLSPSSFISQNLSHIKSFLYFLIYREGSGDECVLEYDEMSIGIHELNLDEHVNGIGVLHAIVGRQLEDILIDSENTERFQQKMGLLSYIGINLNRSSVYGSVLEIAGASIPENERTLEVLRYLLSLGADPNSFLNAYRMVSQKEAIGMHNFIKDHVARTLICPLRTCIEVCNYQSALILIQHQASVDEIVDEGNSIFMYLLLKLSQKEDVSSEKEEVILALIDEILQRNPNLMLQNIRGQTLLHFLSPYYLWQNQPLKALVKKRVDDFLFKNPLDRSSERIQDSQGLFMNGSASEYSTSILKEYPFYQPYAFHGFNKVKPLPILLKHLSCLSDPLDVLLCVYRMCPRVENPKNELRPHALVDHVKELLGGYFSENRISVSKFLFDFEQLKIPYDDLILYSMGFLHQNEGAFTFCFKLLFSIQKTVSIESLSDRSLFFLSLLNERGDAIDLQKLSDSILQKNEYSYPVILLLSEEQVIQVLVYLNKKGYDSALYNPRNIIPRMIEMELYRRVGKVLGRNRRHLYQKNCEEIQAVQLKMQQDMISISELSDILKRRGVSVFDLPLKKEVYGRSIVLCVDGQQYSLKIKKKEEESFLDGAVINWRLQKSCSVIARQFELSELVRIEPCLFDELVSLIQSQKEFENVEFEPVACLIVTKHQNYYDYLFQPQQTQEGYQEPSQIQLREKKFFAGLRQSMYDYSSLAYDNLFLSDLTSNSHGESRSYDFATYLIMNDVWNHGAGVFQDILYGCHISNISTQGLRDLGNLLKVKERDSQQSYLDRLSPEDKKIFDCLSEGEKQEGALAEYTRTLSEHLFAHYVVFLCFIKENIENFYYMTEDKFQYLIEENILSPFCDIHLSEGLTQDEYEYLRGAIYNFFSPLIKEDWCLFKDVPDSIKDVISRETARDFPLQNVFTGFARLLSLVNLKEAQGHLCLLNREENRSALRHYEDKEMEKGVYFFHKMSLTDEKFVVSFVLKNQHSLSQYLLVYSDNLHEILDNFEKKFFSSTGSYFIEDVFVPLLRYMMIELIKKSRLDDLLDVLKYIRYKNIQKKVFNHAFLYQWIQCSQGRYWNILEENIEITPKELFYFRKVYWRYVTITDLSFFKFLLKKIKENSSENNGEFYWLLSNSTWENVVQDEVILDDMMQHQEDIHHIPHASSAVCVFKAILERLMQNQLAVPAFWLDRNVARYEYFLAFIQCIEDQKKDIKKCLLTFKEKVSLNLLKDHFDMVSPYFDVDQLNHLMQIKLDQGFTLLDFQALELLLRIRYIEDQKKCFRKLLLKASDCVYFKLLQKCTKEVSLYISFDQLSHLSEFDIDCESYLFLDQYNPDFLNQLYMGSHFFMTLFSSSFPCQGHLDPRRQVVLSMKKNEIAIFNPSYKSFFLENILFKTFFRSLFFLNLDEIRGWVQNIFTFSEKKQFLLKLAKVEGNSFKERVDLVSGVLLEQMIAIEGGEVLKWIFSLRLMKEKEGREGHSKILLKTFLKTQIMDDSLKNTLSYILLQWEEIGFQECFDRRTVWGHLFLKRDVFNSKSRFFSVFLSKFSLVCDSLFLDQDLKAELLVQVRRFIFKSEYQVRHKIETDFIDVREIISRFLILTLKLGEFVSKQSLLKEGNLSYESVLGYLFLGRSLSSHPIRIFDVNKRQASSFFDKGRILERSQTSLMMLTHSLSA